MTSVTKGWKDLCELLGCTLPLPDSKKWLLDAGATKGKRREDFAKHHIFLTWLIWDLANFPCHKHLSFHACRAGKSRVFQLPSWCKPTWPFWKAWSCLVKQQFAVSKMHTRLHELITVIPAEISGIFQSACQKKIAVLTQFHTVGISCGRLIYSKNKKTNAHFPHVLS